MPLPLNYSPAPTPRKSLLDGLNNTYRDMASGSGTFNPDAFRSAHEAAFPDDSDKETPALPQNRNDWGRLLMKIGMSTMANSQPGSTVGTAIGRGISEGYDDYDKQNLIKDEKKQRRRKEKMDRENLLLNLAEKYGNNKFERDKFDYTKSHDAQQLGLEGMRLKMGMFDEQKDSEGNLFRLNKLTGAVEPVMNQGKPFNTGVEDPIARLVYKTAIESATNGMSTPEEAVTNAQKMIQSMRGAGGESGISVTSPIGAAGMGKTRTVKFNGKFLTIPESDLPEAIKNGAIEVE